jgi:lysophospholipase L1-like esterase
MRRRVMVLVPVFAGLLFGVASSALAASPRHWVPAWGASPQATFANLGETGISPDSVCPAPNGVSNQTVRDIVAPSVSGSAVRVRLTNAYGSQPLSVGAASVGTEESGALAVGRSLRRLTFGGHRSVVIPAGKQVLSDPVRLRVTPKANLMISVYVDHPSGAVTEHWDAQQDSFLSTPGDYALTRSDSPFVAGLMTCWMFTDRVDVLAPNRIRGTVAALGDSITDGFLSDFNANDRWPNDLARRLQALPGPSLSVIDEGIWGNEVLAPTQCCGVSTLSRLNRDVLDQPDVRDIIFLEGINDIGCSDTAFALCTGSTPNITADKVIAGYKKIIARAHKKGIRIFGATMTPFKNSQEYAPGYWTPQKERIRETVNAWIRGPGHFDGVFDFAKAVADPHDPQIINPIYDGGDHLHPNDAGYLAMANTIKLKLLLKR